MPDYFKILLKINKIMMSTVVKCVTYFLNSHSGNLYNNGLQEKLKNIFIAKSHENLLFKIYCALNRSGDQSHLFVA